jgi:hypothetical protein
LEFRRHLAVLRPEAQRAIFAFFLNPPLIEGKEEIVAGLERPPDTALPPEIS